MLPGRTSGALAAVVAVAVLALQLTFHPAATARPAYPPVRPTRVLILGDSVMKGAATVYADHLPGREVVVDAEVNRSTGQGAEVIERVGTDWDVVVILLGHNDGGSPGAYQPAARRILDQLRGVRHVIWLTIHEVRDYYPAVNAYIAGLQAEYPNLSTADWNAVAQANPGALAGDGLHLNGTGAQLMADLVAQQVQLSELDWYGALRALATTTTTSTTTTSTTTTSTTSTTTTTTTPASTTTDAPSSTTARPPAADTDPAGGGSGAAGALTAAAGLAVLVGLVLWTRRRRRRRAAELS